MSSVSYIAQLAVGLMMLLADRKTVKKIRAAKTDAERTLIVYDWMMSNKDMKEVIP